MTLQPERILAAALALFINVAAIWFLVRVSDPRGERQTDSSPIQISWIVRTPYPSLVRTEIPVQRNRVPNKRAKNPYQVQESQALNVVELPAKPAMTEVASDDRWKPVEMAPAAAVPGAPLRFERNPLERRDRTFDAPRNRMDLTFTDRSMGGVLQRLTKSTACGELRRALIDSPASAAAIMRTMERYNCNG